MLKEGGEEYVQDMWLHTLQVREKHRESCLRGMWKTI